MYGEACGKQAGLQLKQDRSDLLTQQDPGEKVFEGVQEAVKEVGVEEQVKLSMAPACVEATTRLSLALYSYLSLGVMLIHFRPSAP